MPISELDRLSSDTWTIYIKDWKETEKDSKGKRYERLANLVKNDDVLPYWLKNTLAEVGSYLTTHSKKWKVISDALSPEAD